MEKEKKEGEGYQIGDIVYEELAVAIPLSDAPREIEIYHYLILEECEKQEYIVMHLESGEVFKTTFSTGPTLKHRKVG